MNRFASMNLCVVIALAFLGLNSVRCAASEAQPLDPPHAVPAESMPLTPAHTVDMPSKLEAPEPPHTPGGLRLVTETVEEELVRKNPDGTETRTRVPRQVTKWVQNPLAQQQLTSDIQVVLAKYKDSEDPKLKEQAVESLTKLTTEQFDAFQKKREEELKSLEEKVKTLRELHDRREKEKQEIVAERVRGLLRNADGLGWADANVPLAPNTFVPANPFNQVVPGPRLAPRKQAGTVPPSTFERADDARMTNDSRYERPSGSSFPSIAITPSVKIFKLKHANSAQLAELLSSLQISSNKDLKIQFDIRTNSIIASGQPSDFEKIEELIKELDQKSEHQVDDPLK